YPDVDNLWKTGCGFARSSVLAGGAHHGRSLGHPQQNERALALQAGGSGSSVDPMGELGSAGLAVRVAVVSQRAAAGSDGLEAGDLIPPEARRDPLRQQGGPVEGLVGVDVADAGEEGLVEEGGLDRAAGAGEGAGELAGRDGEGVGAELVEPGVGSGVVRKQP